MFKKMFFLLMLSFSFSLIGYAERQLEVPVLPMAEDAPGLRAGAEAPSFKAVTATGEMVDLAQLREHGPVVLIFYRGAWCPYCDLHLRSFQNRIDEFTALGASIVAISVDKQEFSAQTAEKGGLSFDVVSDPGADILDAYKLRFFVPDDLAAKYKNEYKIDLEAHSGRTDHLIAVPATYVVDTDGFIQFAYANLDYKTRATPEQVLEVLESLE